MKILALFCAGGLGALSRYGLGAFFGRVLPKLGVPGVPWGTAIVNLLGCFVFGLVAEAFAARQQWNPDVKTVVLTGFVGAFTTFSTYMYETRALVKSADYFQAFAGFAVSNAVGFTALCAGTLLARRLLSA
ncbi:MAG: CrcB family protein [Thermoguttaceae bacterium]|nr:CrcB family protein [Thermoguttaceae bacterium]